MSVAPEKELQRMIERFQSVVDKELQRMIDFATKQNTPLQFEVLNEKFYLENDGYISRIN